MATPRTPLGGGTQDLSLGKWRGRGGSSKRFKRGGRREGGGEVRFFFFSGGEGGRGERGGFQGGGERREGREVRSVSSCSRLPPSVSIWLCGGWSFLSTLRVERGLTLPTPWKCSVKCPDARGAWTTLSRHSHWPCQVAVPRTLP